MRIASMEDLLSLISDPETDIGSFEIHDGIKIHDKSWGTSSALTYKTARYIDAVQNDVIAAWNRATGQSLKIKDLKDHPFLVVQFEIQDGCIEIKTVIRIFEAVFKNMTPKQKVYTISAITLGTLAVCTSASIWKLADTGYFEPEDVQKMKVIAQSKKSADVIINNIGNGTVVYNGTEMTADDIRRDKKNIAAVEATCSETRDGYYLSDSCKFEGGLHLIPKNGQTFTASIERLDDESKKILSAKIADAITCGKKNVELNLQIDAMVRGGRILDAYIVGIDKEPRDAVQQVQPTRQSTQYSLLDFK